VGNGFAQPYEAGAPGGSMRVVILLDATRNPSVGRAESGTRLPGRKTLALPIFSIYRLIYRTIYHQERKGTMEEHNREEPFGFGSWGNQRGRRFRWKIFERGDLKFVILRLISEKPMHGYEVLKALEEESGGCYTASPGSVYPTLQMLEDQGYVRSREEEGKRVYEITDEGREYLDEHGDVVEEIFERIGSFADRFLGKDTRELSAAFSRLAQSTFEGAFAWDLGSDALRGMADALDRARQEVEDLKRGGKTQESEAKENQEQSEPE
jgi:DNA-binding PadR family transcriptional regulator